MLSKCPECGYIHPPAPGGCPVAKEQRLREESESLKSQELVDMTIEIRKVLLEKLKTMNTDQERKSYTQKILDIIKNAT